MGLTPEKTTIGFIGLGIMGKSMAANLQKAGFSLVVYNRTKSKTDELVAAGATWYDTIAGVAQNSDAVITMVGFPKDVEEVYFGDDGIINNAKSGAYLIDMTTSKPALAKKIYTQAKVKGIHSLDAPVSGGDVGARDAKLSIMVGGDEADFEEVKILFEIMGKNIVLQGAAGSGQHTKMCNQIAVASTMIGVCEALVYAKKAGLDAKTVLKSIESGAAASWSLSNLAPRIIDGNFEPGFFVKHYIKDMTIASEEAKLMELDIPGLELAKSLYEQLASEGGENYGTQGLYKVFDP